MAKIKWTHKDINDKIMQASLEPAPPVMPQMPMQPMEGGQKPQNEIVAGLLQKAQSQNPM